MAAPLSIPWRPRWVGLHSDSPMAKPAQIDIVRRAYQLWQQAGEPKGRDQEFYLQAERELQDAEARGDPAKRSPDDD